MTRLIWVLIFAVVVMLLAVWSLKALVGGSRLGGRLADLARAHDALVHQYPDCRFKLQTSSPRPGVRNFVVTVQPSRTDSTFIARMTDSTAIIVRQQVDLAGFDSVVVAVFDKPVLAVPAR